MSRGIESEVCIGMNDDFESIPGVSAAAIRKTSDGEMVFRRASAEGLIQACTAAQIAVLGVEIFPGLNVSTYDLFLTNDPKEGSWSQYVRLNNVLAGDFLRNNPASSDSECILTTASWREFRQIQELRRNS
jgi:hypothetical protein